MQFDWKPGQGPFMKRASIRPIDFQIEQLSKRVLREPFWWYSKPNISYHIHTIINKKRNSVPDMKELCTRKNIYNMERIFKDIYRWIKTRR